MRLPVAVSVPLLLGLAAAQAQTQTPPTEQMKALAGAWELSNADRDRTCAITLKLDAIAAGRAAELDPACVTAFPPLKEVAAWGLGRRDTLVLKDAKGTTLIELLEVEAGMYEGLRPNEGRYFLQNLAAAQSGREYTADQMFGDWGVVRGTGRPICILTLANEAADQDNFAVQLKPDCDPLIARFAPTGWRMDRGQLLLLSRSGEIWRFEEDDTLAWRRIPAARQPLVLQRQ